MANNRCNVALREISNLKSYIKSNKITDSRQIRQTVEMILDAGKQLCKCSNNDNPNGQYGITLYSKALEEFMSFISEYTVLVREEQKAISTLTLNYVTSAYDVCYDKLFHNDPYEGELAAVIESLFSFNRYLDDPVTIAGEIEYKHREPFHLVVEKFKKLMKSEGNSILQQKNRKQPWLKQIFLDYLKEVILAVITPISISSPFIKFIFQWVFGYFSIKIRFYNEALKHYEKSLTISELVPSRWRFFSYWFFKTFPQSEKVRTRIFIVHILILLQERSEYNWSNKYRIDSELR
jgi:hypothetical protein